MISILFIPFFFLSHSVAASDAQATYSSRIHECQNEKGFKRRVELLYESPSSPVPCRAVWFRGDVKNSDVEHVLIRAKHQAGKCEASEQAYLNKLKKWDVSCELIDRQVTETPPETTTPAAVAPSSSEPSAEVSSANFERSQLEGAYAGGLFGMHFGKSSSTSGSLGYNADNDKWSYDSKGFNVGGQIGYNNLWHGLVVGPEFEIGYLRLKGDGIQPVAPGGDTVGSSDSDVYTALRLRVGKDVGRHLIFAALGVMGVNTLAQVEDKCNVAPCGGSTLDASQKGFDWGYTVGAGVEHMFEGRWSLKLEYLYFDLGDKNFSGTTNLGNSYDWTSKTQGHITRGGVNFYF